MEPRRTELALYDRPYCRWYAKCPNIADYLVSHPILGDLPCCKRCVDKHAMKDMIAGIYIDPPLKTNTSLFVKMMTNEHSFDADILTFERRGPMWVMGVKDCNNQYRGSFAIDNEAMRGLVAMMQTLDTSE